MLGGNNSPECDGEITWHQGADFALSLDDSDRERVATPEEERPVHLAMEAMLGATAEQRSAVGFFNAQEVGGHFPRCYFDPYAPACDALWELAVEGGVVEARAPRDDIWLDEGLQSEFLSAVTTAHADDEMTLRPTFWQTMLLSIAYHRGPRFEDRLEWMLSTLESQGRLDDLVLVVLGDHGENPCVARSISGDLNCAHASLPTDWTANVPVFVTPASVADSWVSKGFVGGDGRPWSTVNVSYALMDTLGVGVPGDWPDLEAPGAATSWSCLHHAEDSGRESGIRVVGDVSLRCEDSTCGAWSWGVPTGLDYQPDAIAGIPPEVADFASPNWFSGACAD